VPDPQGLEAGDRGISCASADVFERFGISISIGSNYAAVVPDPTGRPPVYRHSDGTHETLEPISGLVALARTGHGSAVTLSAPDGKRRTDTFKAPQRSSTRGRKNRYDCSNGESVIAPADVDVKGDPCTLTAAPRQRSEEQSRLTPRRGD
jgi:hypothetical protein